MSIRCKDPFTIGSGPGVSCAPKAKPKSWKTFLYTTAILLTHRLENPSRTESGLNAKCPKTKTALTL